MAPGCYPRSICYQRSGCVNTTCQTSASVLARCWCTRSITPTPSPAQRQGPCRALTLLAGYRYVQHCIGEGGACWWRLCGCIVESEMRRSSKPVSVPIPSLTRTRGRCLQALHPPLSPAALQALTDYITGDVFRCSMRMPVEDLAIAMSAGVVVSIPGLPALAMATLRTALADVKRRVLEQLTAPVPAPVGVRVRVRVDVGVDAVLMSCLCVGLADGIDGTADCVRLCGGVCCGDRCRGGQLCFDAQSYLNLLLFPQITGSRSRAADATC